MFIPFLSPAVCCRDRYPSPFVITSAFITSAYRSRPSYGGPDASLSTPLTQTLKRVSLRWLSVTEQRLRITDAS